LEKAYWERRYSLGGTSGAGSIGEFRTWKWKVIEEFLEEVNHVIDVGCGDLSFWEGRDCDDYVGIDISRIVIDENRKKRPHWKFFVRNAAQLVPDIKMPNVFCLDVLYHQMNPFFFGDILINLCEYSTDLIFVYTLVENPFGPNRRGDGIYQFFRPLEDYIPWVFGKKSFDLLELRRFMNSGMYIFKKIKD